jgi:hypothetical protein
MVAVPVEVTGGILAMVMVLGLRAATQRALAMCDGNGAERPAAEPPALRRRPREERAAINAHRALLPPRASVAASGEPDETAVKHLRVIVERLLEQTPGEALCDACLAFAAEVALIDMRHAADELAQRRPGVQRGVARCESCRRETVVTVFRAPTPV